MRNILKIWEKPMPPMPRCPKCGGIPRVYVAGVFKECYVVLCSSCGYHAAQCYEGALTKWGAERIWRRRVEDGVIPGQLMLEAYHQKEEMANKVPEHK